MDPTSLTPVTGAPYSGIRTVQIQQALPGGNQIARNAQSKVYRDSQGRTRTERTITPPRLIRQATLYRSHNWRSGRWLSLFAEFVKYDRDRTPLSHPRSAMTGGLSTPIQGRRNRGQTTTVSLRTQTVNGVFGHRRR